MEDKKFEYTYSAPTEIERKQIESIRKQYMPKENAKNKLERLKYLDNKVKQLPQIMALVFGIIGTLAFGFGLTCALEFNMIVPCVIFSFIGIALIVAAYPVHQYFLNKNRKKYGEEILALSKELLGE